MKKIPVRGASYWDKRRGHWISQISANSQKYFLGSYENKLDAAVAYNEAAQKLHGEYALLNEI